MKHESRAFFVIGVLLAAVPLAGCMVPKDRYDDATRKLHDEQSARLKTAGDLAATRADLQHLTESLKGKEQNLETRAGELAQSKLDQDRVSTERDDAVLLVDQLRGELARVGDNLREFSAEKQELEASLAAADARAKELDQAEQVVQQKELLVRDSTVALGGESAAGKVLVTAVLGKPTVRVPASFAFEGQELRPEMVSVLERVATTVSPSAGTKVELRDFSTDAGSASASLARLQHVVDVLSGKGLAADRVLLTVAPTAEPSGELSPLPGPSPVADAPPKTNPVPPKEEPNWRDGPGSLEIAVDAS